MMLLVLADTSDYEVSDMTNAETVEARPTVLITGGAGEMGAAIASRMARDWRVIVSDIDLARARAVASRVPGATALRLDVADPESIEAAVREALSDAGTVRCLVCASGIEPPQRLETSRVPDWDLTQNINVRGPALVAKALVPCWRSMRGGSIVNIGSRTWLGGPHTGYAASKAGLVGLTRSMALELGSLGVTANVVAPSYVPTQFAKQRGADFDVSQHATHLARISPIRRVVTPQDVAEAVAFLASPGASAITGEVIHVSGGTHLPSFL